MKVQIIFNNCKLPRLCMILFYVKKDGKMYRVVTHEVYTSKNIL